MSDIYFYKPDDKIKYINSEKLWVVARQVEIVNDKREVKKWMQPLWAQAAEQKGIVVYISRLDAEIIVQHLKLYGESWKIYPLDDFNIKEMMLDCKEITGNPTYHFLFSIGFWINDNGSLMNKEGWLSQAFFTDTFNVGNEFEESEHIVIRFSEVVLKDIHNAWCEKIPGNNYIEYLKYINELDDIQITSFALTALEKIKIEPNVLKHPEMVATWYPVSENEKWIYSVLNNTVN